MRYPCSCGLSIASELDTLPGVQSRLPTLLLPISTSVLNVLYIGTPFAGLIAHIAHLVIDRERRK